MLHQAQVLDCRFTKVTVSERGEELRLLRYSMELYMEIFFNNSFEITSLLVSEVIHVGNVDPIDTNVNL